MPGKFDADEMREYLRTITDDKRLERRLEIVQAQIPLAFDKKDEKVLGDLQTHERLIIERRMELNFPA